MGHFGSRVPVPDGADAQAKLPGFIGRDPYWTPVTEYFEQLTEHTLIRLAAHDRHEWAATVTAPVNYRR